MYQDGSFKSINEKVYKILVKQNDDNRELAETVKTSEEADKVINDMVELDGYLLEIMETNSKLMSEAESLGRLARRLLMDSVGSLTQSIGKVTTIMTRLEKKIVDLDIPNLTRGSIGSLTEYRDKYVNMSNILQSSLDTYQAIVGAENIRRDRERRDSTNPLDEIYKQLIEPDLGLVIAGLTKIVDILNMKLLMYQPPSSVQPSAYDPTRDLPDDSDDSSVSTSTTGSGYKGSGYKFSLFNTAPYQPVQKLMV